MGRKTRSSTRAKPMNTKPVPRPNNTPQNLPKQPQNGSIMGNIGQGITFGAGAAIGNSMINSTIDAFSKSGNENNQIPNSNNQLPSTNNIPNKCEELITNFQECMIKTTDESYCVPYINMFNECIKNRI